MSAAYSCGSIYALLQLQKGECGLVKQSEDKEGINKKKDGGGNYKSAAERGAVQVL